MKKGFTLIELLAVIIILGVVALISTSIVLNVINDVKKSAYSSSARMIIASAKDYYAESWIDERKKTNINGTTNLFNEVTKNMQGEIPKSGEIYINKQGEVAVILVYNKTCYIKDFKSNDMLETTDVENCKVTYTDLVLNGADPELDSAMIPVVINSDGTLSKADLSTKWYSYTEKQWANAVLVSDEKKQEYKNAVAGTTIEAKYVRAYYVWIPRYKYQIFTDVNNLEIVGSISSSADYTNKLQIIDVNIEFEDKTREKSIGTTKDEWITHPAFTFGSEELNGIWVGKFETTGTANEPTVLGYDSRYSETNSIVSLRSQNVSALFLTSQKINYGMTNLEASMLKNSEWGAVAYLTASNYGQGKVEVTINNSSKHNTGCAATVAPTATKYTSQTDHTEGYYAGCENEWYTILGQKASTTGNMYGIYDMSGGAWEYVMGVMEYSLGSGIPMSGYNSTYNSGFTGRVNNGDTVTLIAFPDNKYYDLYAYNTSQKVYADRGHLGDATYELDGFSNWGSQNHS